PRQYATARAGRPIAPPAASSRPDKRAHLHAVGARLPRRPPATPDSRYFENIARLRILSARANGRSHPDSCPRASVRKMQAHPCEGTEQFRPAREPREPLPSDGLASEPAGYL